jgi:hypothetical protein
MRAVRGMKPARDVLFVASSGHELGYLGIEIYTERRPDLIKHSPAWIHFGANIGAAQEPGNTIQASDDEMESTLAAGMAAAGLEINRKVPRGTVPASCIAAEAATCPSSVVTRCSTIRQTAGPKH